MIGSLDHLTRRLIVHTCQSALKIDP